MWLVNSKKSVLIACLFVGLVLLLIAAYLLIVEISFVRKATAFEATITEVRKEPVHQGKGSVLAYVPVVEIPNANDGTLKIAVDTFSEEPVYKVGDQMKVLCVPSSLKCVRNAFVDKWGDSALDFLLSLLFLSIPGLYHWRVEPILRLRRREV